MIGKGLHVANPVLRRIVQLRLLLLPTSPAAAATGAALNDKYIILIDMRATPPPGRNRVGNHDIINTPIG